MNPCFRTLPAVLAGGLFCTAPAPLCAGEAPIVVTATRVAQTADETLSSVTVITREDIERSQADSVGELLQGLTGITVVSQGGAGKLTSVYLRGSNPGHVAVLVDGIRMGSVTAGTVSWEFLPLAQVERIEIVRGPNSALYGSEAIGGVVQIFTRRGEGPPRWGVSAGAGRYHSRTAAADYSVGRDGNWLSARLDRQSSDGFDARQPTVEFGSVIDEPDRDGSDNTSASLRVGHRFADGSEIELHGLHAQGNTEYDSSSPFANEDDFRQQAVGVSLRTTPLAAWDLTLSAGRSLDERDSFRANTPGSEFTFNTERRVFSIQNDLALSDVATLSAGFDYHDDRVDSTTLYNETSRSTRALFVQYHGEHGRHTLLARIRPLHDEQFGSQNTGNLAWGYRLGGQTRLNVSWGTAFRSPTFNDLYFPAFMGIPSSNPDLRPEQSETLEVGVTGRRGVLDWDIRAFRTRIDDLIVFDLATFLPGNISEAEIDGIEASLSGALLGWTVRGSVTVLDAADGLTGNDLPRRTPRSLRLDADREFGRASTGATFNAQAARYDDSANTVRVAGYATLDLRVAWQLTHSLALQGRVDNVFDRDYQTVATFKNAGRSLFLTLRYESGP